jgi:hypothetical protein
VKLAIYAARSAFREHKLIARGSTATISLATHKGSPSAPPLALKIIPKYHPLMELSPAAFRNERDLMVLANEARQVGGYHGWWMVDGGW